MTTHWTQGQPEQPEPQQSQFDWNPTSRLNQLARRARMLVARKYGIPLSEVAVRWDEHKDREAKRVLNELQAGMHTPKGYEQKQPRPPIKQSPVRSSYQDWLIRQTYK